jgi:hypothetical protein
MSALWERLDELENQIVTAVPPVDPPPQYWLSSDASPSYCHDCALKARAEEMGLTEPPIEPDLYGEQWRTDRGGYETARNVWREFVEGIDGGFDTSGDDSPRACETCRCTLDYTLTDYGVEEELACFEENPPSSIDAETSFELAQIFLNLTQPWAEEGAPEQLRRAVAIAEQAVSVLPKVPA